VRQRPAVGRFGQTDRAEDRDDSAQIPSDAGEIHQRTAVNELGTGVPVVADRASDLPGRAVNADCVCSEGRELGGVVPGTAAQFHYSETDQIAAQDLGPWTDPGQLGPFHPRWGRQRFRRAVGEVVGRIGLPYVHGQVPALRQRSAGGDGRLDVDGVLFGLIDPSHRLLKEPRPPTSDASPMPMPPLRVDRAGRAHRENRLPPHTPR